MHNLKKSQSHYKDISCHQHKHRIMIKAGLVSFTLPKNGLAHKKKVKYNQCSYSRYLHHVCNPCMTVPMPPFERRVENTCYIIKWRWQTCYKISAFFVTAIFIQHIGKSNFMTVCRHTKLCVLLPEGGG